jgi:ArsR family transcriptional regulator, arsenate/arsenite/antimonite-responsive transcriptional repressor
MDVILSKTLSALADPTRRKILQMLGKGDLSAGEIAAEFNISAPSISHHLSVLKSAELVVAQRQGQNIIYSLNASIVQEMLQQLLELFEVGGKRDAE